MLNGDLQRLGLVLLTPLLAASASADVAGRRIPNALTLSIAAAGLLFVAFTRGGFAVAVNVAAAALLGVALVLAWSRRMLGGGDVKLFAASAVWLGPGRLLTFLAATAIAGGLLAIATAAGSALKTAAAGGPFALVRIPRPTVPYGAAIAAGALFSMAR